MFRGVLVARGTPHIHMILFILLVEFFKSVDVETAAAFAGSAAQKYANERLSCWLEAPPLDTDDSVRKKELRPDFNPERDEYDNLKVHPSSRRVDPRLDYGLKNMHIGDVRRVVKDEAVKQDQRNIVLANEMHTCCFTCHKYGHTLDCRFCFPFCVDLNVNSPTYTGIARLTTRMGNKHRVRITVEAPRNNTNVNRHAAYPSVLCCWRGNTDQTCVQAQFRHYIVFVDRHVFSRIVAPFALQDRD